MSLVEHCLPPMYRLMMRASRRRGALTLGALNARVFTHGQHFRLPSGHRFFLPPDPHFFGYLIGHETHVAQVICQVVRTGDVCVDVGANIGYFSIQMAAICGREGLVLAYEPDRTNFQWLQVNGKLANAAGLRIEAINAAVSTENGQRKLLRGAQSTLHKTETAASDDPLEDIVNSVSIDSEIERLRLDRPLRLIKVDVEGHEPEVLEGMQEVVRGGWVYHAILEVNPGSHAVAVDNMIQKLIPHVSAIRCWVGGQWHACSPRELRHRTDAVVDFKRVR